MQFGVYSAILAETITYAYDNELRLLCNCSYEDRGIKHINLILILQIKLYLDLYTNY